MVSREKMDMTAHTSSIGGNQLAIYDFPRKRILLRASNSCTILENHILDDIPMGQTV
jgi:hypothetical protein